MRVVANAWRETTCPLCFGWVLIAMFDLQEDLKDLVPQVVSAREGSVAIRPMRRSKRIFDIAVALMLLPLLAVIAALLLVLNPLFNQGALTYRQTRMGLGGRPFTAFKFRTMRHAAAHTRGAFDGLEKDRISRLGGLLRRCRIDELPQVLNVLRRDMSLIGPRPDLYDHARVYQQQVPGYAARHQIMPGISGFAQTEVGYVDGIDGIRRKVAADLYYITHATFRFDLWIAWRTLCVIAGRKGQ